MTTTSQIVLSTRAHYFGEPFPIDELEKIPHLHPLAKSIRDVLSATNKYLRDIDLQNRQGYESFVALLNSDLIFRLKITQQYYLLQNLFKDPHEKARWIQFLNEIREEKALYQKQQQATPTVIKTSTAREPSRSFLNQDPFVWTHPDPLLSNREKLRHYEKELQRITFEHYTQRVHVRNESLAADTQDKAGYFDRIIEALNPDNPEEKKAIEELNTIKADVLNKQQEIMSIPIRRADGTLNLAEAERQDRELEQLQNYYSKHMDNILNRLSEKPAIKSIQTERAEFQEQQAEVIKDLDSRFKEQETPLKFHIEQSHRAVEKEEAIKNLGTIINSAKNRDINEHQIENLDSSIKKLEDYQRLLSETEDWDSVQAIMQDCKDEQAKLKEILSTSASENIKSEVAAAAKAAVAPEGIQPLPEEKIKADREPIRDNANLEEKPAFSSQQPNKFNTFPVSNAPNEILAAQTIPKMTKEDQLRYKKVVKDMGFASLSPEMQQIEATLKIISEKIKEILVDEYSSPESKALATTIKDQIVTIKEYTNYQEVPDDLKKSFSENLENLGDSDEELNDFKEKYAPMFFPQEAPSMQPIN